MSRRPLCTGIQRDSGCNHKQSLSNGLGITRKRQTARELSRIEVTSKQYRLRVKLHELEVWEAPRKLTGSRHLRDVDLKLMSRE